MYAGCRWNMEVDKKEYTECRARSLSQMKQTRPSNSCHVHLGCVRSPLFNIELQNIVLDELHLLRIGDVLIRNLILHADSCDQRSRAHRGTVTTHIRDLEAAIYSVLWCFLPNPA